MRIVWKPKICGLFWCFFRDDAPSQGDSVLSVDILWGYWDTPNKTLVHCKRVFGITPPPTCRTLADLSKKRRSRAIRRAAVARDWLQCPIIGDSRPGDVVWLRTFHHSCNEYRRDIVPLAPNEVRYFMQMCRIWGQRTGASV